MKRIAKALAYILFLCAIVLGTSEAYLRYFWFDPHQYYLRPPGSTIERHPNLDELPGASAFPITVTNSLGLRGDELPPGTGHWLIFAIGSSNTEDPLLSVDKTWTYRLQHLLPDAWVGNAGKGGTGVRHHLIQLREFLPRLPRFNHVLVLAGINDMLFDYHIHIPPDLKDEWFMEQAFGYQPADDNPFLSHFRTYYLLEHTLDTLHTLLYVDHEALIAANLPPTEKYRRRRAQVQPQDFIRSVPDLAPATARYADNLRALAMLIRQYHATPVFMTAPALWQEHMEPAELARVFAGGVGPPSEWFENPHTKWYAIETLAAMLAAYNQTMLDVCAHGDATCIDLAKELPKVAANFVDDYHFSETGAARVAAIVATHLMRLHASVSQLPQR